jgi:ABC-2 type transport system ATP-binding protein
MLKADRLRKCFGAITAVDSISFEAAPKDILGILGPNGAGKSTAMKMIVGFLIPDSGTAEICGYDVRRNPIAVKRNSGYLAENAPCYPEMTVSGFLNFVCDARQIKGSKRKEAIDRIVSTCSLNNVYHQTVETLSKGYRRRLGLASSLIHDPKVLILDEPTDGLDPNQKHEVRSLIGEMAATKCIIISTHILEEVEAVCNRSIIISNGRILADSTPEKLKKEYGCSLDETFRKITQGTTRRQKA